MPQPPAPQTPPETSGVPWGTLLKLAASAVGGAAWIQFVGSAVMWYRFDQIGISPSSTVSFLPKDYLFVVGARSLAPAFAAATVAFIALAAWPVSLCIKPLRGEFRVLPKAPAPGAGRVARAWPAAGVSLLGLLGWYVVTGGDERPVLALLACLAAAVVIFLLWPARVVLRPRPPLWRWDAPPADEATREESTSLGVVNVRGKDPPGLQVVTILVVAAAAGWVLVGGADLDEEWKRASIASIVVVATVAYFLLVQTRKGGELLIGVFAAVALVGAVLAVAAEAGRTSVRLTLGVALVDRSAFSGFFVARSSDTAFLIIATQPNGRNNNVVTKDEPERRLSVALKRCRTDSDVLDARPAFRGDDPTPCYVLQLVAVPADRVSLGPRNVLVGPAGFEAGRILAQTALTGEDAERDARASADAGQ